MVNPSSQGSPGQCPLTSQPQSFKPITPSSPAHHLGQWQGVTCREQFSWAEQGHGLKLKGQGALCKAALRGLARIMLRIWNSLLGVIWRVRERSSQGSWSAAEGHLCHGGARSATMQSKVFWQGMVGSLLNSGGTGHHISQGNQTTSRCHPDGPGLRDGQYRRQYSVGVLQVQSSHHSKANGMLMI